MASADCWFRSLVRGCLGRAVPLIGASRRTGRLVVGLRPKDRHSPQAKGWGVFGNPKQLPLGSRDLLLDQHSPLRPSMRQTTERGKSGFQFAKVGLDFNLPRNFGGVARTSEQTTHNRVYHFRACGYKYQVVGRILGDGLQEGGPQERRRLQDPAPAHG